MAKFEHRRYPALTLQDAEGIWAQFTPEERTFGENKIKVGVLETDDAALVKRLEACPDEDLVRVDSQQSKPAAKKLLAAGE